LLPAGESACEMLVTEGNATTCQDELNVAIAADYCM